MVSLLAQTLANAIALRLASCFYSADQLGALRKLSRLHQICNLIISLSTGIINDYGSEDLKAELKHNSNGTYTLTRLDRDSDFCSPACLLL